MRFGLLWTYKELHQTDNYLLELENAFIYLTKVNPAKIFWNNNESITNPRHFVVEKTQQCFHDIEIDDEELFDNNGFMHKYCDLMIKYFPRHKYGYSDKGIIYCKSNDLKNGLAYHFKAFSLDNQDALIAANIGFTYKLMGDKVNAIKYFNKVLEISKEEYYVEGAKRQLEELRKK
jgi:tetratricopeptide (TPR) repeat protein